MDWPIAYMKTVWMHSSRLSDFYIAKEAFLGRLRDSYATESVVLHVDRATSYIQAHNVIQQSRRPLHNEVWVPCSFHPLWEHHAFINNLLRSHVSDPFYNCLLVNTFGRQFAEEFDMSVAWRVSIRPFGNTLIAW